MEFLTNLFGNVTSGMIRLGVAVGIIAAIGLFIVRPILDSTDHAIDSANEAFKSANLEMKAIQAQMNKAVGDANRHVQVEVRRSLRASGIHGDPQKVLHCIQRANENVHRIERCTKK